MVTRIAVVKYRVMFWMSLLKRSYAQNLLVFEWVTVTTRFNTVSISFVDLPRLTTKTTTTCSSAGLGAQSVEHRKILSGGRGF